MGGFSLVNNTSNIVIGLVGTSGSGKNEVSKMLESSNFFCIDADIVTNQVIMENQNKILDFFLHYDSKIKNNDGSLNKKKLSSLLFSNEKLLIQHENFIYPLIEEKILLLIKNSNSKFIILNAPTLHKSSLINITNIFIYVTAPYIIRVLRIKKRDNISLKKILLRFKNQKNNITYYKNQNKKIYYIYNWFTKKYLHSVVENIKEKIEKQYE